VLPSSPISLCGRLVTLSVAEVATGGVVSGVFVTVETERGQQEVVTVERDDRPRRR
jgi:hypothetical protein